LNDPLCHGIEEGDGLELKLEIGIETVFVLVED
jgi:hypothetical protein